uniref:Uncharacterized protein n=1 Tax=Vespula pensylvanica TaxID=30213 RepID=A0A834P4L4_VESPE|nr:hypothetical protein H0235_006890 [Vespula pensylvanica]
MDITNTNDSTNENPAEPKTDVLTVAEGGLPESPEIVADSTLKSSEGSISYKDEPTTEETENTVSLTQEEKEKHEVHFAIEHTSITYVAEEESISIISILLEEYFNSSFILYLPRLLTVEDIIIEYQDKFTQTFFKAMTKLSDRRFVQIINMQVDHDDPTLIFYCPSYELLTSFHENEKNMDD